ADDPKNVRMNPVRFDRRFGLMRGDVTALDKDLLGQRDPDRITGDRFLVAGSAPLFDRLNFRRLVRRRKNQFVPYPEFSSLDSAGDDATLVEPINVLHAKTQGKIDMSLLRLQ